MYFLKCSQHNDYFYVLTEKCRQCGFESLKPSPIYEPILKYFANKSKLIEVFWFFFMLGKIAILRYWVFNMSNSILLEFDKKKKLISQCYNGTNIMDGPLNSSQTNVKRGCS